VGTVNLDLDPRNEEARLLGDAVPYVRVSLSHVFRASAVDEDAAILETMYLKRQGWLSG
jgi:hypothetical protein